MHKNAKSGSVPISQTGSKHFWQYIQRRLFEIEVAYCNIHTQSFFKISTRHTSLRQPPCSVVYIPPKFQHHRFQAPGANHCRNRNPSTLLSELKSDSKFQVKTLYCTKVIVSCDYNAAYSRVHLASCITIYIRGPFHI